MKKKARYIGEVVRHYAALLVISVFVLLPYYWYDLSLNLAALQDFS